MGNHWHMPSTDTVEDEKNLTHGQDDAAPNEGQDNNQVEQPKTPGEPAAARPKAKGDKPHAKGDDLVVENDPLTIARKGPLKNTATTAKPPAASKAKPTPKPQGHGDEQPPATDEQPGDGGETATDKTTDEPPTETPNDQADEQAKKPAAEDDDQTLSAKLSDEAWGKLNHKDKSTFLAIQKTARIKAEEARTARQQASKFKSDYDTVERFVKDSGLDPDSYRDSVLIAGMTARNDPRALPALESAVQRLRKVAGIPEPTAQAAAPAVDPDELMKALEEAETSLDFDKAKQLVAKLKGAKPAAPVAPVPSVQQQQRQPATAGGSADPAEEVVNESIEHYLIENGVPPAQVVTHLQRLITTNPQMASAPVRERLRAVMRAHSATRAHTQIPQQPRQQPIQGRGRSAGGGRTIDPKSQDPLVLARQGKLRS